MRGLSAREERAREERSDEAGEGEALCGAVSGGTSSTAPPDSSAPSPDSATSPPNRDKWLAVGTRQHVVFEPSVDTHTPPVAGGAV